MDDMHPFEQQVAAEVAREMRPSRPVDAVAVIAAVDAVRSPKWRFQSMFSATKFLVAGAIVALFSGFLLTGVLTQQPSDERLPAVGASASATTQAEPTDAPTSEPAPTTEADSTTTTTDLLPGVELDTEEVAPGVYRVLSDGVRDITDRVRQVTIQPEGDVWVELSNGGKGFIVRLGERGVSLELPRKQRGTLGMTAGGAPVVIASQPKGATRILVEGSWRKTLTELSEYDRCWLEATRGWASSRGSAVGADGACYTSHGGDDEPLVRIDAEGTRTAFTRDELGLGPEQNWVDDPVVGPDGSIWATVFGTDLMTGIFRGLVRYDGSDWSFIPYDGDDAELCGSCSTGLAIDRDGVVWVGRSVGVADAPPVLSWDGESWGSYLQGKGRGLRLDGARAWPNGDIWFGSDVRWDGTTVSPAEPLLPWGELFLPTPRATAPDGSVWTVIDEQLYVVTPEAVMVTE